MNHVDDAIDIALSTLFIAFMLAVGVWCMSSMKSLYAQPVIEKTAPTVQLNMLAPEYEYSGASCLLGLVVNDAHCPTTKEIRFYTIRESQVDSFYSTPPRNQNEYYTKSWFDEIARRATPGQPGYDSTIGRTTVTYNNGWFSDKEVSINLKWDVFFNTADWDATSKWYLQYNTLGNPAYWQCVIINP